MRFHVLAASVAAIAVLGTVSAQAATFNLFFDAAGTDSDVTALLTANDTANADGSFTVTAMNGTVGADTITGFTQNPSAPLTITSSDGLYIFSDLLPVDNGGLLFNDSAGQEDNLYLRAGPSTYNLVRSPLNYPGGVDGTLKLTAVPEPASWALMLIGFGGVGGMIRNRQRKMAPGAIPA